MMPAVAAPPPGRAIALPTPRLLSGVAALTAVSWAMVGRFEAGLAAVVILWLGAAPFCLRPLVAVWRAELPGAVSIFAVAGSVWFLDERVDARFSVLSLVLAVGVVYLVQRRAETLRLLRSPVLLALAALVAMQIASAWLAGTPELPRIVQERAFMLLFVLCAAVVARRPGGRLLLPALLLLCTLASLPVMLRELADPFPGMAGRAGGLYGQANVAGIMLSFGVAAAGVLYVEGALSGVAFAPLAAAFFVGIFASASRGALINALSALAVTFGGRLFARWGRTGLAFVAAAVAAVALLQAPLSSALVRATQTLESVGYTNAERLQDTVLALTGSADATDDVMAHDSNRVALADDAVTLIARRPVLGYGTGRFIQSHVQFLEILGENGVIGALFYAVLLAAVARALLRLPRQPRLGATILFVPWLATQFHSHNIFDATQFNAVLAYVAALSDRYAPPAAGPA